MGGRGSAGGGARAADASWEELERRMAGSPDGGPAEVANEVRTREGLGRAALAALVAGKPQLALEDLAGRMGRRERGERGVDPILRLQHRVIAAECRARIGQARRARGAEARAPVVQEVVGGVIAAGAGEGASVGLSPRLVHEVVAGVRRAAATTPPGAARVARVLRDLPSTDDAGGPGENAHRGEAWGEAWGEARREARGEGGAGRGWARWVRWGLALELLGASGGRFGSVRVEGDPVTQAAARRAAALYYGSERQDGRGVGAWPMELAGEAVGRLVEGAERAEADWVLGGRPEAELQRLLRLRLPEETGRGPAHGQVVAAEEARRRALAAGGLPFPLLFPVDPGGRARAAAAVWRAGALAIAPGELGVPLYSGGGDPRVRWGAGPHPYGLLCAAVVPRGRVLHLHRRGAEADETRLEALRALAAWRAGREDVPYQSALRRVLQETGIDAIARYDYSDADDVPAQEIVLLSGEGTSLVFLREAMPAFRGGDRGVLVPGGGDAAGDAG